MRVADTRCRPGRWTTANERPFARRVRSTDGKSYGRGVPGVGRLATTVAAVDAVAAVTALGRDPAVAPPVSLMPRPLHRRLHHRPRPRRAIRRSLRRRL